MECFVGMNYVKLASASYLCASRYSFAAGPSSAEVEAASCCASTAGSVMVPVIREREHRYLSTIGAECRGKIMRDNKRYNQMIDHLIESVLKDSAWHFECFHC
jgi:hypothetical protein